MNKISTKYVLLMDNYIHNFLFVSFFKSIVIFKLINSNIIFNKL